MTGHGDWLTAVRQVGTITIWITALSAVILVSSPGLSPLSPRASEASTSNDSSCSLSDDECDEDLTWDSLDESEVPVRNPFAALWAGVPQ